MPPTSSRIHCIVVVISTIILGSVITVRGYIQNTTEVTFALATLLEEDKKSFFPLLCGSQYRNKFRAKKRRARDLI